MWKPLKDYQYIKELPIGARVKVNGVETTLLGHYGNDDYGFDIADKFDDGSGYYDNIVADSEVRWKKVSIEFWSEQMTFEEAVALLDKHVPGWVDRIDTNHLDMKNGRNCILGQLFGSYTRGRTFMMNKGAYMAAYGPFDSFNEERVDWTPRWKEYIASRQPSSVEWAKKVLEHAGYQVAPPKKKVKKWKWVLFNLGNYWVSADHYTKEEVDAFNSRVIYKIEETEIEVDE